MYILWGVRFDVLKDANDFEDPNFPNRLDWWSKSMFSVFWDRGSVWWSRTWYIYMCVYICMYVNVIKTVGVDGSLHDPGKRHRNLQK